MPPRKRRTTYAPLRAMIALRSHQHAFYSSLPLHLSGQHIVHPLHDSVSTYCQQHCFSAHSHSAADSMHTEQSGFDKHRASQNESRRVSRADSMRGHHFSLCASLMLSQTRTIAASYA